jgi:hypothetical protein
MAIQTQQPSEGFSISEFRSNVLQNGYLKPSLYLVNFSPAAKGFIGRDLFFYTDTLAIPAVDLATQTIYRYGYGPEEQVALRPIFQPMTIDFMVQASAQNILTEALNYMTGVSAFMNYNSMVDPNGLPTYGGSGGPYEMAYKNDYKFDLAVYMYNDIGTQLLTYTFRDCLAKTVGGLSLSWASTDQYIKSSVTFVYTDYTLTTEGVSSGVSSSSTTTVPETIQDMMNTGVANTALLNTTPDLSGLTPPSFNLG